MSYLKFNPNLKISSNKEETNIFGNIGITSSLIVKENNTVFYKRYDDSEPMFYTSLKDYVIGFNFGIGVSHKTIHLEYRFETGNGISKATSVRNRSFTHNLILYYSFI